MNIIQIYAPNADKKEEECEEFYAQLEEIFRSIKRKAHIFALHVG